MDTFLQQKWIDLVELRPNWSHQPILLSAHYIYAP